MRTIANFALWILTLCLCGALCIGCGSSEAYIKAEIAKAAVCTQDDECVSAASKCPFGCYVPVNKKEQSRIKGLVDGYESGCAYDCLELDKLVCEEGRCKAIPKK